MSYVPTKLWPPFRRHVGHSTSIYHPPCRILTRRGYSAGKAFTPPNHPLYRRSAGRAFYPSFSPSAPTIGREGILPLLFTLCTDDHRRGRFLNSVSSRIWPVGQIRRVHCVLFLWVLLGSRVRVRVRVGAINNRIPSSEGAVKIDRFPARPTVRNTVEGIRHICATSVNYC